MLKYPLGVSNTRITKLCKLSVQCKLIHCHHKTQVLDWQHIQKGNAYWIAVISANKGSIRHAHCHHKTRVLDWQHIQKGNLTSSVPRSPSPRDSALTSASPEFHLVPLEVGLVFDHFNKRLQEKQSILIYGNYHKGYIPHS